jgi:hypothetical protein
MELNAQIQGLLEHFGRTLGLEGLTFDEEGLIELRIGDKLSVTLGVEPHQQTLILSAEVLPETETLGPTLLRRVLITNARLATENGPSFAIAPEIGSLLLQQRIPLAGLDYPGFEQLWLAFLETHEIAVSKLEELAPTQEVANRQPAGAEVSPDDHTGHFLRV